MIRTFYTDTRQIDAILASLPQTLDAVEAAARVYDLGLTITDDRAELDSVLRNIPDAESRFTEVGGFFFIVHGRPESLPETPVEPPKQATSPPESDAPPTGDTRYGQSRAFWLRAAKYGWFDAQRPWSRHRVLRMLADIVGRRDTYGLTPNKLTTVQFAEAWRKLADGSPAVN
jgi:hypothetical protein